VMPVLGHARVSRLGSTGNNPSASSSSILAGPMQLAVMLYLPYYRAISLVNPTKPISVALDITSAPLNASILVRFITRPHCC
jgi:hypothetical protein